MDAIQFENVSKQYRLGLVGTGTLAHDIRRFFITNIMRKEDPYLKIGETNDRTSKGNSDYVWALRDITFNVEQGDVVGIIGKNGAGKSTLLKLLSRVTGPTTGTIRAHGRIGSLLEVGTGFHPEMTGRENIFMNGAILGMTKREIQAKLDEIIDFSGCERYIDTPVKRYSSGMMVRLGFAVAAHLDPEILVVDEVLAVGDAEFQKKAIGKMQDVSKGEGRTVLFVSHNMGSIQKLCNHCVLLANGQVQMIDVTHKVIDRYLGDVAATNDFERAGSGDMKFVSYAIDKELFPIGEGFSIDFEAKVNKYVARVYIHVDIHNEEGEKLAHVISEDDDWSMKELLPGMVIHTRCNVPIVNLAPGRYVVSIWLGDSHGCYDYIKGCMKFAIYQDDSYILRPDTYSPESKVVLQSKWLLL